MPAVARTDTPSARTLTRGQRLGVAAGGIALLTGFALTPSWGGQPGTAAMPAAPAAHRAAVTVADTTPRPAGGNLMRIGTLAPAGGSSVRISAAGDSAPVLRDVVYARSIYPLHDGYRDSFTATMSTDKRTVVTLVVRDVRNRLFHSGTVVENPGRFTVSWNGYARDGHLAGAGTYHWYLVWHDADGNWRESTPHVLALSHRHLITRTARYVLAGDAYWRAGATASCARASRHASFYRGGVWLSNQCTGAIAAAFYRVRVPAAVSYPSIAVQVWGFTSHTGSRVFRAFGKDGGSGAFDAGSFVTMPDTGHRIWSFGSVPGAGRVGSGRYVVLALSVDDRPSGARDLDIKQVRAIVTYRVLN